MFLYKRSPRFRLSKFWMLTVCEISNNVIVYIFSLASKCFSFSSKPLCTSSIIFLFIFLCLLLRQTLEN